MKRDRPYEVLSANKYPKLNVNELSNAALFKLGQQEYEEAETLFTYILDNDELARSNGIAKIVLRALQMTHLVLLDQFLKKFYPELHFIEASFDLRKTP